MKRHSIHKGRKARRAIAWLRRPLDRFLRVEAASGVVLLAAAVISLVWANSPWSGLYQRIWQTPITADFTRFGSTVPLNFWINDGLMTLFFVVVGAELRSGFHGGVLADRKRATLPVLAAVGGMLVPALIYLCFNTSPLVRRGWGVPMATDIAFSLGVLTLLGSRVPPVLRVLLLALATVDDIGSIAVIAIFYPSSLSASGLILAGLGVLGIVMLRRWRVRRVVAYLVPGAVVWFGALRAGIHPAVAGIPVGLLIPIEEGEVLHSWVAFGIVPLFALANAGVGLHGLSWSSSQSTSVMIGVLLARLIGKPVGILVACVAATRCGICEFPRDVDLRGLLLVGILGAIGFTVPIYIASVAFSDTALLAAAKVSLLVASALSAVVAIAVGRLMFPRQRA